MSDACIFCDIVARRAPATIVAEWGHALAIVPLNAVTDGHVLVIPKAHVADATESPEHTGMVARAAATIARQWPSSNLITSVGEAATQTIRHLHFHVVPRRSDDGLSLPWSTQRVDA